MIWYIRSWYMEYRNSCLWNQFFHLRLCTEFLVAKRTCWWIMCSQLINILFVQVIDCRQIAFWAENKHIKLYWQQNRNNNQQFIRHQHCINTAVMLFTEVTGTQCNRMTPYTMEKAAQLWQRNYTTNASLHLQLTSSFIRKMAQLCFWATLWGFQG